MNPNKLSILCLGIIPFILILIFYEKLYIFENTTTQELALYIFSDGFYLNKDLIINSLYLSPRSNLFHIFKFFFINYESFIFFLILLKLTIVVSIIPIIVFLINLFFEKPLFSNFLINSLIVTLIYFIYYKFSFLGWNSPRLSISPSLISFVLISIALLYENKNLILFYFLFFLSFYIHPISPLFYFLFIFFKNINLNISLVKIFTKKFILNIIFCISIFILYKIYYSVQLSSESIDIYLQRHSHHYIPSQYLDLFSILNILILFVLIFFDFHKIKRLIVFYIIYLLFINSFQFTFVEFFQIKSLSMLGINRLNTFHFFFIGLIIINYFNDSFKKTINIKFQNNYFIFIFLTFLTFFTFYVNYKNESSNKSNQLLSWITTNTSLNDQLILIGFEHHQLINHKIRIYSKRSIYSDSTFPMSMYDLDIKNWNYRNQVIRNLRSDIQNVCNYNLNNDVIFIIYNLYKKYNFLKYKSKYQDYIIVEFNEIYNTFCN